MLTDRSDLMALNPYHGFLQWQVYYTHPASHWKQRTRFLADLAGAATPAEFAARSAGNPFDRIDAFVLRAEKNGTLTFNYREDRFPAGTTAGRVAFARTLFDPATFDVADLGQYVVAVRR